MSRRLWKPHVHDCVQMRTPGINCIQCMKVHVMQATTSGVEEEPVVDQNPWESDASNDFNIIME